MHSDSQRWCNVHNGPKVVPASRRVPSRHVLIVPSETSAAGLGHNSHNKHHKKSRRKRECEFFSPPRVYLFIAITDLPGCHGLSSSRLSGFSDACSQTKGCDPILPFQPLIGLNV